MLWLPDWAGSLRDCDARRLPARYARPLERQRRAVPTLNQRFMSPRDGRSSGRRRRAYLRNPRRARLGNWPGLLDQLGSRAFDRAGLSCSHDGTSALHTVPGACVEDGVDSTDVSYAAIPAEGTWASDLYPPEVGYRSLSAA